MTPAEESIGRMERLLHDFHRSYLLHLPENQAPKSLVPFGYRVYSQIDEDGIIAEIFRRIGTNTRHFVEFGVENGMENNTTALLVQGWKGAWIEGNPQLFRELQAIFRTFIARQQLIAGHGFVTAETIEQYLDQLGTPADLDLLSIDIDYNDYWVWKAITRFTPRLVIIEYNASFGPSIEWKVAYSPQATWDGASRNFGASLKALELLGREKGYVLVGCTLSGANAFFVRQDLAGDKFLEPATSERHYQPPRYMMKFPEVPARSPAELANFP